MCVLKYFNDISQRLTVQRKVIGSHLRCSVKTGFPRNFEKFTGKHLCQSPLFNKVGQLRLSILLKKRLWHCFFFCEFCEISRSTFSTENLRTFMNQFCLTTFSSNYFKGLAVSFFLVFPSRLSVTFDIQSDLKTEHPQLWKVIRKHIQNHAKHPRWRFLQK